MIQMMTSAVEPTTASLTSRLSALRTQSSQLSSELLAKLTSTSSTSRESHDASSGSSSLLHMASTITSILPPQLQRLDQELLGPIFAELGEFQIAQKSEMDRIQLMLRELEDVLLKGQEAQVSQNLYQDLDTVSRILSQDRAVDISSITGDLDFHMVSLERAAHLIHSLLQHVTVASDQVRLWTSSSSFANKRTTESTHFILKLAPLIRQAKDQLCQSLLVHLEHILTHHYTTTMESTRNEKGPVGIPISLLLALGHIFRSLTLLKETSAAERVFVKTVTMPIIRSFLLPNTSSTSSIPSHTSTSWMVARLDEGGPRGECMGLSSLLRDIIATLQTQWGDVLIYMEDMLYGLDTGSDPLHVSNLNTVEAKDIGSLKQKVESHTTTTTTTTSTTNDSNTIVDLLTMGIWVPLATVLTADSTMKMAIFSPGIAHVLQANYTILDTCISNLASSLLLSSNLSSINHQKDGDVESLHHLYHCPRQLSQSCLQKAQHRIQSHGTTLEFYKKFNLPIYYQLRFAEITTRVNTALDRVRREGWKASVYTGTRSVPVSDMQLPIFLELQDCLVWLWKVNVYLKPMTHRFIRGVVQILGRFIAFIMDGLDGKMLFGQNMEDSSETNPIDSSSSSSPSQDSSGQGLYSWVDRIDDVASVSCDAHTFKSWIVSDYLQVIQSAVSVTLKPKDESMGGSLNELISLCKEVLVDASQDLELIVTRSWDDVITQALIKKCMAPIAAVKGIAATFRMTNRPPPTLASPFVVTIVRPLKEFNSTYATRVPQCVGSRWKERILSSLAEKYCSSVAELIETVQKTEEALKNRKSRKTAISGLSDGDKVKMQLYLDSQEFLRQVQQLDLDPTYSIEGLRVLLSLTEDGKVLFG